MFSYLFVWATRTCTLIRGVLREILHVFLSTCVGFKNLYTGRDSVMYGKVICDADYGQCVVGCGCSRRRRVATDSCDVCIKVRKIVCGSLKLEGRAKRDL